MSLAGQGAILVLVLLLVVVLVLDCLIAFLISRARTTTTTRTIRKCPRLPVIVLVVVLRRRLLSSLAERRRARARARAREGAGAGEGLGREEHTRRRYTNSKRGGPGYTPSSCGRCAKPRSVVGTPPDRLRYCCNGQSLPYRSDRPSAGHVSAPLIDPAATKRAESPWRK